MVMKLFQFKLRMESKSILFPLVLYVLLVKILGNSAAAQESNLPHKKSDAWILDRLDLSIFDTNSDAILTKYLWPVVRYKQCSESVPILSKLTTDDCPYPCSTTMARFKCQIICMKRDDCVGINYSKSKFEYRYMCGICTGDNLQTSTYGFEFHPNPRKKADGCLDYWKSFVSKAFPITKPLNRRYGQIIPTKDLLMLLEFIEVGDEYTMVFNVSSNCHKDIEIGFSGEGGWFKTSIPANSNIEQLTVTDNWKPVSNVRLENRWQTCGAAEITIHHIQLFKGPVNCLIEDDVTIPEPTTPKPTPLRPTTFKDAILIPNPKNDNKKCGSNWLEGGATPKRTFELSDENFSETECLENCAQDQNCVAMSSGTKPSGGKWCHGCKVSLDTYHPLPTTAFRKVMVEYYSGVGGELCNEESHVIRSREECINALQKLGIPFSSENDWTGSSQDIPSGCSIQDDIGRTPHFETSSTGLGTGRNDQAPICQNQLIYECNYPKWDDLSNVTLKASSERGGYYSLNNLKPNRYGRSLPYQSGISGSPCDKNGVWISFEYEEEVSIMGFRFQQKYGYLKSGLTGIKTFRFEISKDEGLTWSSIYEGEAPKLDKTEEWKEVEFKPSKKYRFFRLFMIENWESDCVFTIYKLQPKLCREKILDPDPQNDNKICGRYWFSTERVFVLHDSEADEVNCQEKCAEDQNCVAMSGIWGQWCIGCSEPLNSPETPALSFRKGCEHFKCLNGGQCIYDESSNESKCECIDPWDGNNCHLNSDNCSPTTCKNNGVCTPTIESFTCTCQSGYEGEDCSINVDDCYSNPCRNEGTCTDDVNRVHKWNCECKTGYLGADCSICKIGYEGDDCTIKLLEHHEWCCAVTYIHEDFYPNYTWGSFTNGAMQQEWEKRNCNAVHGASNCHEGSFPTNKDWCCGVLQVYSDFVPMQTYGSFTNGHKRKEWEERNCNSVVGGSRKTNCLARICEDLPISMNGKHHPKGCPGAVLSNGTPVKSYCEGMGGKLPWWKDCCTWTGKECVPNVSPFDATVKGTETGNWYWYTTEEKAKIGSKIWKDRGYTISSISNELLGASLFQSNHYVDKSTMLINSNKDAVVFVAVYEEESRDGGLMEALQADGWTLKSGLYLEWLGQHKLNKVWSRNIKAMETISFTSTENGMTFAIIIKEETCYQPDAEITNGEWKPKTSINGEHIVKEKCTENTKCVGYWKRGEGVFGLLEAGGRTWAKDKPNTTVKGVWKKTASCQHSWKLIAEKKSCVGSSRYMEWFSTIDGCAKYCKDKASMFTFGTNDFGFKPDQCQINRWTNGKMACKCFCRTSASDDGTCTQKDSLGYRLYGYH